MKKFKTFLLRLIFEEKGITAMETGIILIAFVVISAVFAYTVLSAGMFSTQVGGEAVYRGLEDTSATLEIKGNTIVKSNGSSCTAMIVNIAGALDGSTVDFTPPNDVDADGLADSDSTNVVTISYNSQTKYTEDLDWSISRVGKNDSDNILETGEVMQVTVDLTGVGESIGRLKTFTIELKPPQGAVLEIERTVPGALDTHMILR